MSEGMRMGQHVETNLLPMVRSLRRRGRPCHGVSAAMNKSMKVWNSYGAPPEARPGVGTASHPSLHLHDFTSPNRDALSSSSSPLACC